MRLKSLARPAAVASILLAAVASADAALFAGNSPAVERFDPANTTDPNSAFLLSGFDTSGIAVDTNLAAGDNAFGATLITPQYVALANHFLSGNVSFRGNDGVLRTYTYDRSTVFRPTTTFRLEADGPLMTMPSDVAIARLDAPADASIAPLPILNGATADQFVGLPIVSFGQSNRAGTNVLDEVIITAFEDADGGINSPTVVITYDFDAPGNGGTDGTGDTEIGLFGGDSSNGAFAVVNGELALIGSHFGIDTETPGVGENYGSSSSFLAAYLDQIDANVAAGGGQIRVVAVPEPAAAALAGVAALALLPRRRRAA